MGYYRIVTVQKINSQIRLFFYLFINIFIGLFSNPLLLAKRLLMYPGGENIPLELIASYYPDSSDFFNIIEAGTFDGQTTIALSKQFPKSVILGLEPVNENYLVSKDVCHSYSNIEVLNKALHFQNTESLFFSSIDKPDSGSFLIPDLHSVVFKSSFQHLAKVQSISLETVVSKYFHGKQIDLLWLDVQGFEYDLIRNSPVSIFDKILGIHLEVSRIPLYQNQAHFKEIHVLLKKLGYKLKEKRIPLFSGNCFYSKF
jgi:FkbM family methyltransferase